MSSDKSEIGAAHTLHGVGGAGAESERRRVRRRLNKALNVCRPHLHHTYPEE